MSEFGQAQDSTMMITENIKFNKEFLTIFISKYTKIFPNKTTLDIEKKEFPVRLITAKQLLALRIKLLENPNKSFSYCVIKIDNKYYIAKTDRNVIKGNVKTQHLCPTCAHCYACSGIANGKDTCGCQKVADRFYTYVGMPNDITQSEWLADDFYDEFTELEENPEQKKATMRERMIDSKRIEKYNFITVGIETINCSTPTLSVCRCRNYKPDKMPQLQIKDKARI